jgi:hypothetical protein
MRDNFRAWLERQSYAPKTISTKCSEIERVEYYYDDLDRHFAADRLETVLASLEYSTNDQRDGLGNPSKLPIDGDLRTNLASYKAVVVLFRRFREEEDGLAVPHPRRRTRRRRDAKGSPPARFPRISIGARVQFWLRARG